MIAALFLLMVSPSQADDLVRPKKAKPTAAECSKAYPLRVGEKPPPELIDPATGLVRCAAVAEPTSSLAYLLATERHRDGIERLWVLDVQAMQTERDFYRARYAEAASPPWYQTPAAQRWGGRLETLVAVGLVAGVAFGADNAIR